MSSNYIFRLFILGMLELFLKSCVSNTRDTLFTDVTEQTGISFANLITEQASQNILNYEYEYNGGGVAVGDVNADGLADIYFTGNQAGNKLYLNRGDLLFEDVTEKAGVGGKPSWATGVTMADVNGDGSLDLYVCYSGTANADSRANLLYINSGNKNGIPVFSEKASAFGLDARGTNSTQAAFFDYDRDGDLDMFLLNHATMFYSPLVNTAKLRAKFHPFFSNRLYRNEQGHFREVTEGSGIKGGGNNFGLGICVSDINNDGWPDVYTTNDFSEQDFLYINNHDGTFRDASWQSLGHISKNGMGCDVADYNNDGLMDIVVADMLPEDNKRQKLLRGPDEYDLYHLLVDSGYFHQNMRNTLQMNRFVDSGGTPRFSEIGQVAGVSHTDWSWAPLFADLDNDGNKDLFISNGFLKDFTNLDFLNYTVSEYRKKYGAQVPADELIRTLPSTTISNYIFRNMGDLTFENVTGTWGFGQMRVSNGAVYADLDNDGDLDVVVNNLNAQALVYRNNTEKEPGHHYLRVQLLDSGLNRFAIGAKVTIETASHRRQVVEMSPVRGFQSAVDPVLHFGLGAEYFVNSIRVRWPDGAYTTYGAIKSDTLLILTRSDTKPQQKDSVSISHSIFTDISFSAGIHFTPRENTYVDFKHEFLLPWQLSRQGPKLSKGDVNNDGREDLFIGAPRGQAAQLYLQTASNQFVLAPAQPWKRDSLCEDIQSVFFDADGDGDQDLYVVSGGNEAADGSMELMDRLYVNDGSGNFTKTTGSIPAIAKSKSCVAAADYNKDGKLDLFIGGRLVAGKYGAVPESFLLTNESSAGKISFRNNTPIAAGGLQYSGMVTDACWNDINQDGWPDLIVVGEWMPVKIFINRAGRLEDASRHWGLSDSGGLWTSVIPCDPDGDGDTDFLLGNLAPNTQLKASVQEPMTLCVNEFSDEGLTPSSLLCYYIQGASYPFASRDELVGVMPALKKKFLRYEDYAMATINDVFTPSQLSGMRTLYVCTVQNCWLQNSGNGQFTLKALPPMAQFSALQGAATIVHPDKGSQILVCGNFYPFRVELGREDGGKGCFLSSDNNGELRATDAGLFPLSVEGDVRDMISLKTKTGRTIIIIAKNDGPVQVITNN